MRGREGKIKRNRLRGECVRMDVVSTCACYVYLSSVSVRLSVYPSSV